MPYTITSDAGKILTATEEQAAIVDFALSSDQSLLVNALAGAAKTSTIQFLCKYLPTDPILSLAFNKRIAERLAKVLPGNVRSATVNSIGHRGWSATIGRKITLDTKKSYNAIKEQVDALPRHLRADAYDEFGDMVKTIGVAKLNGYVPKDITMGRSLLTADEFFGRLDEEPSGQFVDMVNNALRRSIKLAYQGTIDFDDQ